MRLLIMDAFALAENGGEGLREIRKRMPGIRMLVLDGSGEKGYSLRAVEEREEGYLLEDIPLSELRSILRPLLWEKESEKLDSLTKREREVLGQAAQGKLNKEIADFLKISERTVKNHLSSIFRKLEVSDRTQAAIFALRNQMMEG